MSKFPSYDDIQRDGDEIAALRAEVRRLKRGLEKYGDHTHACNITLWRGMTHEARQRWYQAGKPAPVCDCGYDRALSHTPSPTKRKNGDDPMGTRCAIHVRPAAGCTVCAHFAQKQAARLNRKKRIP